MTNVWHIVETQLVADAIPPLAAHVVTSRVGYTHHGIHVGNGRVVHYSGLSRGWRDVRSKKCRLPNLHAGARFAFASMWTRDSIAMQWLRARSRLGENRYRALSNNCEHLCEWCIHGENRSRQIERLRSRWLRTLTSKNLPSPA